MQTTHQLISSEDSLSFLRWAQAEKYGIEYQSEKHQLAFTGTEKNKAFLRLPIQTVYFEENAALTETEKHWVILLVRAGAASIGYFENGDTIDHKTFHAYMVRKKQGKSQVKYLNTKGKSRAGSRVRLASTEIFFKEIGQRLDEYLEQYYIDHICIACAKTLWPFLFNPKVSRLSKADPRIMGVPKHVQHPTFESLLEVNRFMQMGELKWDGQNPDIKRFFSGSEEKPLDENDDW
ncbi:hypothetical protein [Negadavirga shengliensis]|uniref:VLRF1 domain-containing protein n=1 Tax=Negadavirga shengliensis TaxID=1389218 RepID=A0ABV9T0J1_9BACT